MRFTSFREPVRLLFHLNGVSRVALERLQGVGLADRDEMDVPTDLIPHELRVIGARFFLVGHSVWPEAGDTANELREIVRTLRVEAIKTGG